MLSFMRALSLDELSALRRFAARRLNEEHLPQVAGSLTFTTVLALVPIVTIAFAIFTTFPLFNTFRASLDAYFLNSLMPGNIANVILSNLNQFADKATRLSAFGAVGLVLTAIIMMFTIDRAINKIWRVRAARPLAQKIVIYWAIITLGPLLIGVSISVTSYFFTATNGVVEKVPVLGRVVGTLISVLLTTGAFTLLYVGVPNREVDWRDAAAGGVLAAVAFEIAKRLFVVFITQFPTYTVIYGALAAVPIFLLWVYVSWLIALVGAVFAAALPVVRHERWWHAPTPGSAFVDAVAVLRVLYEAGSAGAGAVDARAMRAATRLGFDEAEALLQKMLEAGWVGRLRNTQNKRGRFGKIDGAGLDRWVLLAHPQRIRLADVYRVFVFQPAADSSQLALQAEAAIETGLHSSLKEWFDAEARKYPAL